MRHFLFLLGFAALANAQKPDPKLHAEVWTLIKLDGTITRLRDNIGPMVEEGKKEMMRVCLTCSPKFGDEWASRMKQRMNADEFGDIMARTYEKYLTYDDVRQLVEMESSKGSAHPKTISPALRKKLAEAMPRIQSEVKEGSSKLGGKLGSQVGSEIGKEHPEYVFSGKH